MAILISTPQELNNIRNNLTVDYELANDIDMSTFGNFTPIGDTKSQFTGSLDGKGYKIKNLTINTSTGYFGLFALIINASTKIKNVGIENCKIHGSNINWGGSIVGQLNGGTIENCYATGEITGQYMIGGIVGQFINGIVKNCYSNVKVSGVSRIGGLVGYTSSANCKIENSYSTGQVTSTGVLGGLIGEGASTVTNSFWDTETSGITVSAGGIRKSTSEMKIQSTYTNWDFINIWGIDGDYPYLQVFGVPIPPAKIGNVEVNSYANNFFSNLRKSIKLTKQLNTSISPIVSNSKRHIATLRNVATYLSQINTNATQSHRTVRSSTQNVTSFINPISTMIERRTNTIHNLLTYVSPIQAHIDVSIPLNNNVVNAYTSVIYNPSMATSIDNMSELNVITNPSFMEVIT